MKPEEVSQSCFELFSTLTMNMSDEDRWSACEELQTTLEGVSAEQEEKRMKDDAY